VTPLSHSLSDRLFFGLCGVCNNSSLRGEGVEAGKKYGTFFRNSVTILSISSRPKRATESAIGPINKSKKDIKTKLTVTKGGVMSLANDMIAIRCDIFDDILESISMP
jgi:hypothetical protein